MANSIKEATPLSDLRWRRVRRWTPKAMRVGTGRREGRKGEYGRMAARNPLVCVELCPRRAVSKPSQACTAKFHILHYISTIHVLSFSTEILHPYGLSIHSP